MGKKPVKILVLVEGAKTDIRIMIKLLDVFGLSEHHEIVSYNTNIYDLYQKLFSENAPETLDLLQVLKEHEKDPNKKHIFNEHYSDIILLFDLDPQDPRFSSEAICQMSEYFNESSDTGKLYLNYPMIEAFYHMKSIPDPDYNSYTVLMDELYQRTYKARVRQLCRVPYNKFANTKEQFTHIIQQNLEKTALITEKKATLIPFDTCAVLQQQLSHLKAKQEIFVLCTCVFYITDYNPSLLM